MREKPKRTKPSYLTVRITPACAGKTHKLHKVKLVYKDHPRVCGKNFLLFGLLYYILGSPPRVREKRPISIHFLNIRRITPACAGKTSNIATGLGVSRDHPRVCGKNLLPFCFIFMIIGSPPRVREKQRTFITTKVWGGITPACAGKTHKLQCSVYESQDHPRVCGKNVVAIFKACEIPGSPPRVREKLAFQVACVP